MTTATELAIDRTKYNVAAIRDMYERGMSQSEIAKSMGCNQVNIAYLMRTRGIQARKAIKRNQRGANNASWRGDKVTYKSAHQRVRAVRGAPNCCRECGRSDSDARYEWASISRQYYDPNDYVEMCVQCHRRHDAALRKSRRASCQL